MFKLYSIAIVLLTWSLLPGPTPDAVKLVTSPYSFNKTIKNIKVAIASNNFRIVREKTGNNAHTLYFCNFDIAHKAILKDKKVGALLPCKIKIIKNKSKIIVATVNVDALINKTGIKIGSLCNKIKSSIDTILEDSMI